MDYSFYLHQEVTTLIRDTIGLRDGFQSEEYRLMTLLGLTRHNFNIELRYSAKELQWLLRIVPNGKGKDSLLEHVIGPICEVSEFCLKPAVRTKYEFASANIDELIEQVQILKQFVEDNGFGVGMGGYTQDGVNFQGTQFDRLKERGATISGMFGNLVCQASGMRLEMTQAEYYVEAGELDGVEFNEAGEIISIYECQSGIHRGEALDEGHLHKTLSTYLYDREIIPTVRKVVFLAGAYREADLIVLRERSYELSRRERPIELVALVTTRQGNCIGVERLGL